MGISFSCPGCGTQIPVPDGSDPSSCPKCGYALSGETSSETKASRYCMNCKRELRSGVTLCPQCGTDQETGRRSFGYGKRKLTAKPDGDDGEEKRSIPAFSMYILLVAAAGIVACILYLTTSDRSEPSSTPAPGKSPSRPPGTQTTNLPPVAPHVWSNSVSVTQPKPLQATSTTMSHRDESMAAAVSRYETFLRQGRLDAAQQERLLIEQKFARDMTPSAFWKQAFAPATCVNVSFCYPCTICTDGLCPVCHNTPSCASCRGSGTCSACAPASTRRITCSVCVCQTCDGSGRCTNCTSYGLAGCKPCGALGYTDRMNLIACGSCGGTGQRKGLRTAGGYMPIRCLTCNGSGKITQHIRQQCAACGGRGQVKCPSCSGNKLCAACRGIGRTPSCLACKGIGTVDVACKVCGDTRKCPTCSGVGHCQRCLGHGNCYMCKKTGLIIESQLPLSSAWLSQGNGYMLYDFANQRIARSSDKPGRHQIPWNGRTLTIDVAPNEVVWICTSPSFQQISSLIVPK